MVVKRPTRYLEHIDATQVNPFQTPCFFDGTKAHETCPFEGDRITLIFYEMKWKKGASVAVMEGLRKYGFSVREHCINRIEAGYVVMPMDVAKQEEDDANCVNYPPGLDEDDEAYDISGEVKDEQGT